MIDLCQTLSSQAFVNGLEIEILIDIHADRIKNASNGSVFSGDDSNNNKHDNKIPNECLRAGYALRVEWENVNFVLGFCFLSVHIRFVYLF